MLSFASTGASLAAATMLSSTAAATPAATAASSPQEDNTKPRSSSIGSAIDGRHRRRSRPQRRGSLPLKKRRVITTSTDHGFVLNYEEQHQRQQQPYSRPPYHMRMHRSSSLPPLLPATSASSMSTSSFSLLNNSPTANDFSFSKMNALSLIASAVVATEASIEASASASTSALVPPPTDAPGLAALSYASSEHSLERDSLLSSDLQRMDPSSSPYRSGDDDGNSVRFAAPMEGVTPNEQDFEEKVYPGTVTEQKTCMDEQPQQPQLDEEPAVATAPTLYYSNSDGSKSSTVDCNVVLHPRLDSQSAFIACEPPRKQQRNPSPPVPSATEVTENRSSPISAPPVVAAVASTVSGSAKKTVASIDASLNGPEVSAATLNTLAVGPDKRCTGLADEIRCSATTTRGRACAYIAVGQTKYCYLHADYDTNPAPRRKSKEEDLDSPQQQQPGGSNLLEDGSFDEELSSEPLSAPRVASKSKPKQRSSTPVAKATEDKPPSPSPTGKVQFKKRFRRTSTKLAEMHADSPRPLLSMVATDHWYKMTVQIAVGPLEGRRGIVEKWGNGWVSVQVKGAGLHNRRSFELYIDEDEDSSNTDLNGVVRKERGVTSLAPADEAQKQGIPHIVSRDLVSPSPSTDGSTKSRNSAASLGRTTPLPKISRRSSLEKGLISPRHPTHKMAAAALAAAIVFPETPRATAVDQASVDGSDTPVPTKAAVEAASKLPLPKVTPFSERSTTKASPPTLSLKGATTAFDLQLPDASSTKTKCSFDGTKGMVFRPSIGESTRGRTVCSSEDDDDEGTAHSSPSAALAQRTKKNPRDDLYLESSSCSFSS